MQKKITIIGAGIAGTFLAILLGREGYTIEIFESRPDPRMKSIDEGKSYSLSLYNRAMKSLKKVKLWEKVKSASLQIETNVTHLTPQKVLIEQMIESKGTPLYTIHRSILTNILLDELEKLPNVKVLFNTRLLGVEKRSRTMYLQDVITKQITSVKPECIIGADGIHSVVRSELQRGLNAQLNQEYFGWGYKKVTLPAEKAQLLHLQPKAIHHWPADEALLIAFPHEDGSFTCMFNIRDTSAETLKNKKLVKSFLTHYYPEFLPVAETIASEFIQQPFSKFVTIYSNPWYFQDFMLFLGDAAHAVVPLYGQGVCTAFEDCFVLQNCLQKNKNREKAFEQFQALRKAETDMLASLSKKNFNELRDKSNACYYMLRDILDTILSNILPHHWSQSLSTRIVHNSHSYLESYKNISKQRRITRYLGINTVLYVAGKYLLRTKLLETKNVLSNKSKNQRHHELLPA